MRKAMARSIARVTAGVTLAALAATANAVVTHLDTFTIVKNGGVLFQDTFADGVPPPSGPGEFATYLFLQGAFVESGGKLTLNSATGPITTNATGAQSRTTRATFSTNIVASDTVTGLKSNHTFSITGLFDLVTGTVPGDNYSIRFVDRDASGAANVPSSNFGNDFVELRVSHSTTTGDRIVSFRRQDFQTDTITNIASFPISPALFAANDQIALTLSKEAADSDLISASFAFVSDGVTGSTTTFAEKTPIFHGENWTRAEFVASQALAPIPEPETYAMMLVGIGLIGWQLRRKHTQVGQLRAV